MRKLLAFTLLAIVLLAAASAAWAGASAGIVPEPAEIAGLVEERLGEFVSPTFVQISRSFVATLLRGPPSPGTHFRANRTDSKESEWRNDAGNESPRRC